MLRFGVVFDRFDAVFDRFRRHFGRFRFVFDLFSVCFRSFSVRFWFVFKAHFDGKAPGPWERQPEQAREQHAYRDAVSFKSQGTSRRVTVLRKCRNDQRAGFDSPLSFRSKKFHP